MEGDALPGRSLRQAFTVARSPKDVLDAAQTYLDGAGTVSPRLRGRMERFGDALAIHHGRIETRITTSEAPGGTRVEVLRRGQKPLEDTRKWLLLLGLGGFLLAWAVTFYNETQGGALHPLLTIGLFLAALVATASVLYVADRSLERRSEGLVLALQDAVQGDPVTVLRQETRDLERSSATANGLLFYCAGLVISFVIYAILWSPEVVRDIDQAAALTTMRFVFLFPLLPALAFAGIYLTTQRRAHRRRLDRFVAAQ